jgi:hypothetical protein
VDIISDGYQVSEVNGYDYITYTNDNYKPEIISPFNILHEVSTINNKVATKLDKLYFEIHPISCKAKNESYFFKLSANNEDVLKEYINYVVVKKRGLKILLQSLFKEMDLFKI